MSTVVKAAGLDKGGPYGLGLEMAKTAGKSMKAKKAKVPLKLEQGEMPLNTYKNKTPFVGKIKSVERIVGPKATGETTHIIIDHGGKMPCSEQACSRCGHGVRRQGSDTGPALAGSEREHNGASGGQVAELRRRSWASFWLLGRGF